MNDARRPTDGRAARDPHLERFVRCFRVAAPGAALMVAILFSPSRIALANCELIISEYVEGSGLNKVVEIQNALDSPVNLGAGGYQLVIYLNGCATSTTTIDLIGTIQPHEAFVLAHPRAAASILALADQLDPAVWFDGDDALALVRAGGPVLDVVGQIGFDPGAEWGTGAVSTADNTLRRKSSVVEGDHVGSDPFDPATGWDGYATDAFDDLGVPNTGAVCGLTGLSDLPGEAGIRLFSPRPNPSGAESSMGFSLATRGPVRIVVVDVAGRHVRVLAEGDFPEGTHVVRWDGRDDTGRLMGSGLYFVRLTGGETRLQRTLVRIAG